MAVWSSFIRTVHGSGLCRILNSGGILQNSNVRLMSSHRVFQVEASRWQWHKAKDLFHFYFLVSAIPLGLISGYANIFIGPAQLAPIPEGYEPKEWEYYRHPITRFFVQYFMPSEQQVYEKHIHQLYEDYDQAEINRIESEVKDMQRKRKDYQHWYYLPVEKKYSQAAQEAVLDVETVQAVPYNPIL